MIVFPPSEIIRQNPLPIDSYLAALKADVDIVQKSQIAIDRMARVQVARMTQLEIALLPD
jgi:hypothetical protein